MRPASRLALSVMLAVVAAGPAVAHTRSTSYSSWEIDGRDASVRLRIPQLELTRLPWGTVSPLNLPAPLARYLPDALRLEADGEACVATRGLRVLASPPERAVFEWELRCPNEGALVLTSNLLREVAPSHLHFARFKKRDGSVVERVLTKAQRSWLLPAPGGGEAVKPEGSGIPEYVRVGVEHIVTGYDHLVFLLGLLLLARRAREVVTIVTGFTIAHSITLALAALGRVQPEAGAVEALIGLSIALIAAENGWLLSGRGRALPAAVVAVLLAMAVAAASGVGAIPPQTLLGLALFAACYFALLDRLDAPAGLRAAIAFCFGLVHGFGFAGVLTDISLPQGRLLPALLGFNVGVELGQLVLIAALWPVLRAITHIREGRLHRVVVELGTAVVCGLGIFWMVERAYGA
ncbi:MAG: HupE/UreJ family protein [bacterium]|nr:HupE/UreJ family protein [bacterium]MCP5071358.1 HupE/UreJ family protein [bacterium]